MIPDSPIQLAFLIEPTEGEEIFEEITDQEPEFSRYYRRTILDFALTLAPGDHKIVQLLGKHPDLDEDLIAFPGFRVSLGLGTGHHLSTLSFLVPDSGCFYIGE